MLFQSDGLIPRRAFMQGVGAGAIVGGLGMDAATHTAMAGSSVSVNHVRLPAINWPFFNTGGAAFTAPTLTMNSTGSNGVWWGAMLNAPRSTEAITQVFVPVTSVVGAPSYKVSLQGFSSYPGGGAGAPGTHTATTADIPITSSSPRATRMERSARRARLQPASG